MPNTLAHIGFQTLFLKAITKGLDIRWILLGCIIPDLPWIIQRLVKSAIPAVDQLELRSYVVVQSSLLFCIIASLGFALLAQRIPRTFAMLGLGCLLHLLLDASQTKWANGVHLWAPWDWSLLNFGWYWPESWVTYTLTALGLGVSLLYWRSALQTPLLLVLNGPRLLLASVCCVAYLVFPVYFSDAVYAANNHYIGTLSLADRKGQYLEFDRKSYQVNSAGEGVVDLFGEQIIVRGVSALEHDLSGKAVFENNNTLLVSHYHMHPAGVRDAFSLIGLCFILSAFVGGIVQFYRQSDKH